MANKWHDYYRYSRKDEAEKAASRLRRMSAHRKLASFKVRIVTKGKKGQRWPKRMHLVQWYGPTTAL